MSFLLLLLLVVLVEPPRAPAAPLLAALPRPVVFAHRGGAAEGPESTLPTIERAARLGAVIELDVRRTRDGHIVVFHDATVDRTTNGRGRVDGFTLAELKALDAAYCFTPRIGKGTARREVCRDPAAAAQFPLRGQGYQIATLAEVLRRLPERTIIGIEVKAAGFEAELAALLRGAGRLDRLIVGSGIDPVAARLRELLPEALHYFPRAAALRLAIAARLFGGRLSRPGYDVLATPAHIGPIRLDGGWMRAAARRLGVFVAYFIINDEEEIEALFRAGADAVMTDYPARALDVRMRLGGE